MYRLSLVFVLFLSVVVREPVRAQSSDSSDVVSEEVTYTGGDVTLAATVLLPTTGGPFPGVVIVHGSGSSDRSNPWTTAYAEALVRRGIAVVHPDKRGSGESGGNWREATFGDLADDALAGVEVLREQTGVDTARIGVIGFSQGGYIVPIAAARSPEVAFVINVSGAVVPLMEQIGDELRLMGRRENLTDDELDTVQSIHKRAVRYATTGQGWEDYARALAEAKTSELGGTGVVEGFPTSRDAAPWTFLRTVGDFNPLPYWREVDVPALFLYGGKDENVDVFKSADIIEEQLTPAGLAYSLLLFRNNGHALFRHDAMEFMARWIADAGAD